MSSSWAIYKRELLAYFKQPLGFVLIAIYAGLTAVYFSAMYLTSYVDLAGVFEYARSLFFILIPLLTMRSFAPERTQGTNLLLLSSPASSTGIVLAKFLATSTMFLFMSLVNLGYLIATLAVGGTIDARYYGTLCAYLLTALAYIAIGLYCASASSSQLVAALVAVAVFVSFDLLNFLAPNLGELLAVGLQNLDFFELLAEGQAQSIGQGLTDLLLALNPANRLAGFYQGTFDLLGIIYLLSITIFFLFLSSLEIEGKRYK